MYGFEKLASGWGSINFYPLRPLWTLYSQQLKIYKNKIFVIIDIFETLRLWSWLVNLQLHSKKNIQTISINLHQLKITYKLFIFGHFRSFTYISTVPVKNFWVYLSGNCHKSQCVIKIKRLANLKWLNSWRKLKT